MIEIGYGLKECYWGKGLATELAKALMEHAGKYFKNKELVGTVHAENHSSIKVLESMGFSQYGVARKEGREKLFYCTGYKDVSRIVDISRYGIERTSK